MNIKKISLTDKEKEFLEDVRVLDGKVLIKPYPMGSDSLISHKPKMATMGVVAKVGKDVKIVKEGEEAFWSAMSVPMQVNILELKHDTKESGIITEEGTGYKIVDTTLEESVQGIFISMPAHELLFCKPIKTDKK